MRDYICAKCGKSFSTTRLDPEAMMEYQHIFGKNASNDKGVVCDKCYKEFWEWAETLFLVGY